MRPVFRPVVSFNNVLRIEDNNFVELVGVSSFNGVPRNSYEFRAKFNISVNRPNINPRNYNKVIVTVKKKLIGRIPSINSSLLEDINPQSNQTSQVVPQTINSTSLNQRFGLNLPELPSTLERKIYSGLQIVSDASRVDPTIAVREITLNYAERELNSLYRHYDLVQDSSPTPNLPLEDYLNIQTNSILTDINRELVDITSPVNDTYYASLSSKPDLPLSVYLVDSYAVSRLQLSPRSLYAGAVWYYLNTSPRLPRERSLPRYTVKENIRKTDLIPFEAQFRVGSELINETLEIKFDLYEKNNNVPIETQVKEFSVSNHVSAFESIKKSPQVNATLSNGDVRVSISDRETTGKVVKFKVYVKDIDPSGDVTPYRLEGEVSNISNCVFTFRSNSQLMMVRVVPINAIGEESNIYTNVVVGESYPAIGKLSIVPSRNNFVNKINVYNIPRGGSRLNLYWKPDGASLYTQLTSKIIDPTGFNTSDEFFDMANITGCQEYFVEWVGTDGRSINSPSVVINNSIPIDSENVVVNVREFQKNIIDNDTVVSFKIETIVKKQENETIKQALSGSLNEVYEQLLSSENNRDTAAKSDDLVTPFYADLYVHEVVRTSLNTGERSVFELVINGDFVDNSATRSVKGIPPINPKHSYIYQIFSFRKNPLTLLKNYVKKVVSDRGHVYYYSPYKWDDPGINATRTMPVTDGADLPIRDLYENLTSTPLGEKNQLRIDGLGDFVSVTSVTQERIDRNTIKVTWSLNVADYSSFYDSFVVMKTVNGTRSFVGATRLNYIYHEIDSEKDVGNIYYTVIPVTAEFDIDDSMHSSPFLLNTQGLKDPVLLVSS